MFSISRRFSSSSLIFFLAEAFHARIRVRLELKVLIRHLSKLTPSATLRLQIKLTSIELTTDALTPPKTPDFENPLTPAQAQHLYSLQKAHIAL